jgi:hypothetical protein
MSLVISLATMFGKTAAEKLFRALGNRRNGCSGEYQGVSPVHSGAPSRGVKQVIGYVKVMRWGFSSRSPTSDCNPYSESSLKAVKTTSELAGAAVSAYANPNILIDCSHNSDIFCLAHFLRISELDTAKQFIILMRRLTISVLMPFAFFGCAAVGVNDATGQKITDPNAAFAKGEIRLTCGLACSGAWGAVRNKLRQLHDNSLWSDLKLEVLKIGKEADLAYYYIGRAAEGEGNFDAAKIYYRLALAASFKCSGVINVCDKFVFPGDINIRLNSLPVTVRSDKISNAEQVSTEATGSKNIPAAVENNANPSISQLGMGAVDLGQEAKGIASKLVTKYDEFRKVTEYSGPNIAKKDVDVLMIRAWKGEGVEASFQIYVKHFHNDDWRFYSTAFDDTGRALDFTSISREIATCSHGTCFRREFFGLNIDRNYLVSKKNSV